LLQIHDSPFVQLRHTVSLVFHAAAACPIFGRRRVHLQYLQLPVLLGMRLSQRSLERANVQLWCHDNKQRAQLLCCSSPLSMLAFRLARAVNRREGSRRFELTAIARVMKRCFSVVALRFFITN
jgi:hypothetical protein